MKTVYYDENKKYVSPRILVFSFTLEETIATASAQISGPENNSTPSIIDWEEETDNKEWEF